MGEDKVKYAASPDVKVGIVEQNLVHVFLVEHAVHLSPWALRLR